MQIQADMVVSIEYILKNDAGDVLDANDGGGPLHYLHGHGNIVEGLEAALAGRSVGDSLDVAVAPEQGYGVRDETLIFDVPRKNLPQDLDPEIGMQLGMTSEEGETVPVWIRSVTADSVRLDANHELAGETLHFSVKVLGIRPSTPQELAHGHVHGAGGHHHH